MAMKPGACSNSCWSRSRSAMLRRSASTCPVVSVQAQNMPATAPLSSRTGV
jgi:hypothetical protein